MPIQLTTFLLPQDGVSPVLEDKYVRGGFRAVQDWAELEAIPVNNLKERCLAYIKDTNELVFYSVEDVTWYTYGVYGSYANLDAQGSLNLDLSSGGYEKISALKLTLTGDTTLTDVIMDNGASCLIDIHGDFTLSFNHLFKIAVIEGLCTQEVQMLHLTNMDGEYHGVLVTPTLVGNGGGGFDPEGPGSPGDAEVSSPDVSVEYTALEVAADLLKTGDDAAYASADLVDGTALLSQDYLYPYGANVFGLWAQGETGTRSSILPLIPDPALLFSDTAGTTRNQRRTSAYSATGSLRAVIPAGLEDPNLSRINFAAVMYEGPVYFEAEFELADFVPGATGAMMRLTTTGTSVVLRWFDNLNEPSPNGTDFSFALNDVHIDFFEQPPRIGVALDFAMQQYKLGFVVGGVFNWIQSTGPENVVLTTDIGEAHVFQFYPSFFFFEAEFTDENPSPSTSQLNVLLYSNVGYLPAGYAPIGRDPDVYYPVSFTVSPSFVVGGQPGSVGTVTITDIIVDPNQLFCDELDGPTPSTNFPAALTRRGAGGNYTALVVDMQNQEALTRVDPAGLASHYNSMQSLFDSIESDGTIYYNQGFHIVFINAPQSADTCRAVELFDVNPSQSFIAYNFFVLPPSYTTAQQVIDGAYENDAVSSGSITFAPGYPGTRTRYARFAFSNGEGSLVSATTRPSGYDPASGGNADLTSYDTFVSNSSTQSGGYAGYVLEANTKNQVDFEMLSLTDDAVSATGDTALYQGPSYNNFLSLSFDPSTPGGNFVAYGSQVKLFDETGAEITNPERRRTLPGVVSGDVITWYVDHATGNVWLAYNDVPVQGNPAAGTLPIGQFFTGTSRELLASATSNAVVGDSVKIYTGVPKYELASGFNTWDNRLIA